MTYGHLTLAQFEQRQGNPYFEEHGRWYRITETYVIRALDRVNYQAEECDPREAQAWLAEKAVEASSPPSEQAPVVVGVEEAGVGDDTGEPLEALPSTAPSAESERYISDAYEDPTTLKPRPPRLADYAREHGWPGVGRISNEIKKKYEDEFGVKTYSY